ncbi:nucleolar complex protein 4 homolog A-like [Hylaeus volcanicus]|uniref:nucleolar complex protein 4 homolog A-like n=1 Tax=Hylaeus volcanicus TaxID=313075 RepID=UPI0023B84F20|nr:nucleolar complex protein 4 homolog A-like [Hylaeus volcanicus]
MGLKQKRALNSISNDKNEVHVERKKQKVAMTSKHISSVSLEQLSHKVSKLSTQLETIHLQEFTQTLKKLWELLIPLRLERKLGINYSEETFLTTREKAEAKWLADSFMIVFKILLSNVQKDIKGFGSLSLKYLMKCLRIECKIRFTKKTDHSTFPLRLLESILKYCISTSATCFTNLCNTLIEDYFYRYKDLQFYSLQTLESIVVELLETNTLKEVDTFNEEDINIISRHIFLLLHSFPSPKEIEKQEHNYGSETFCLKYLSSNKSVSKIDYQNAFVSCWMKYLRLSNATHHLSLSQYKEVLSILPTRLLPFLKCPLVISHIFFQAFYHNDLQIAVEALSGLFYLIVKSRLAEPQLLDTTAKEFYAHLLTLVQPKIFSLNVRTRFIRLLEASLRSKLLSSTMKAAFIKRLVSVSLLTPPGAALWLLTLALSLLQLSGSGILKFLLLRNISPSIFEEQDPLVKFNESNDDDDGLLLDDAIPFTKRMCAWTSLKKNLKPNDETCETLLHPYSLWELNCLKRHWDPSVRNLVNLFDEDIFSVKATRIDTKPFLNANNSEIFFSYMKPLMKEQDKNFYQYAPINVKTLSENSSDESCLHLLRLASFYNKAL